MPAWSPNYFQGAKPLTMETATKLAGNNPDAAKFIAWSVETRNPENLNEISRAYGIPVDDLLGLGLGKPIDSKFLAGTSQDQRDSDYIQQGFKDSESGGLLSSLDKSYADQYKVGTDQIDDRFRDQRQRGIEENAIAGRTRDPNSLINLGAIDTQREKAVGSFAGQLGANKVSQEAGLRQYLDSSLRNQLNANRTNQNALNQQDFQNTTTADQNAFNNNLNSYNQYLSETGLQNNIMLQKKALEPKAPTAYDWVALGLGGLNAGANVVSAFKK